ncbi:MAG: hypothetical protein R2854_05585 [Caldilineaceae bacterium]
MAAAIMIMAVVLGVRAGQRQLEIQKRQQVGIHLQRAIDYRSEGDLEAALLMPASCWNRATWLRSKASRTSSPLASGDAAPAAAGMGSQRHRPRHPVATQRKRRPRRPARRPRPTSRKPRSRPWPSPARWPRRRPPPTR